MCNGLIFREEKNVSENLALDKKKKQAFNTMRPILFQRLQSLMGNADGVSLHDIGLLLHL